MNLTREVFLTRDDLSLAPAILNAYHTSLHSVTINTVRFQT